MGDTTRYVPRWPSTIAAAAAAAVSATLLASSNARSASCDVEKRATRHWSMWNTLGGRPIIAYMDETQTASHRSRTRCVLIYLTAALRRCARIAA